MVVIELLIFRLLPVSIFFPARLSEVPIGINILVVEHPICCLMNPSRLSSQFPSRFPIPIPCRSHNPIREIGRSTDRQLGRRLERGAIAIQRIRPDDVPSDPFLKSDNPGRFAPGHGTVGNVPAIFVFHLAAARLVVFRRMARLD
ncbi:uncharacterized protein PG998_013025 [Apiospora kogelbergensis]|uniref:uncharacterized protein n=1 Tax=Apiospora kogelbergensis TaxID=1337665 RepID=UPI0031302136